MSEPKKCPHCGTINPDGAVRCDCGYDFQSEKVFSKGRELSESRGAVARGRAIVITIIALVISLSFAIIALYFVALGTEKMPHQLIRLVLTLVLAWFVYRGRPWARWVMALLLICASVMGLILIVMNPEQQILLTIGILSAIYGAAGIALIASRSVTAFMDMRTGRR